ncbi:retropepsin-like aspartic protease [Sphingobacterium rhinopitheci]|uniref:retropepsin-like aspartic protease n=1 Tax=Sphingobacterium rhinopitheci TaxID=2781960 RepID=UPI001F523ED4|nr:retropepsin-like aspartic protease [Sphingobacterium rhinopitheci]MCI0920117.1 clan AA aspartic protease [Sphingobacterium rhinopitheci]
MHIIPFEILTIQNDGFHIILNVILLQKKFKMVLDTGASKTVLDKQLLIDMGLAQEELISSNILSTGLGTNEMESHTLYLESLMISDWTIKNIQVAVLDLSTINYAYQQMNFPAVIGVLGGDILYKYGAVIDYKKKTLKLNSRKIKSQS